MLSWPYKQSHKTTSKRNTLSTSITTALVAQWSTYSTYGGAPCTSGILSKLHITMKSTWTILYLSTNRIPHCYTSPMGHSCRHWQRWLRRPIDALERNQESRSTTVSHVITWLVSKLYFTLQLLSETLSGTKLLPHGSVRLLLTAGMQRCSGTGHLPGLYSCKGGVFAPSQTLESLISQFYLLSR